MKIKFLSIFFLFTIVLQAQDKKSYQLFDKNGKKVSASIIWERFPKFVLGFIMASIIFSFLISPETAKVSGKVIKSFSTFWFNLAFISIGLETRFADLKAMDNKKPFYGFLIGQGFNIIFTLIVSYLLFQVIGPK